MSPMTRRTEAVTLFGARPSERATHVANDSTTRRSNATPSRLGTACSGLLVQNALIEIVVLPLSGDL
ncbi:hypothetical protein QE381_000513 [Microbacterium sp. SORGH_AS 888]|nr:hypothetical protein [Microbacterium sp. SORGH_AS_0888]